jgi:nitrogen fixation protein NifZ
MLPAYDYGDEVRVTRNVRNDGTFPGIATGELLVRRGSAGHVVNIGTFLQDQIIYTVHFLDIDRMVGCREEELIPADAPWTPSRFESREKVEAARHLVVRGETRAALGTVGEILRVRRDEASEVHYEVIFPGHVLRVPESALRAIEPAGAEAAP